MHDAPDMTLLRKFAEENSEEAFATIVRRHVNMVYSAALRKTGNPHAAEEISQAVFIILAKKAGSLPKGTILTGWLYQTTRLTAANALRNEIRRAHREQEAYMQSLDSEAADETWQQIAPHLDDAMGQLSEKDRNALALRFFEGKSFQEVGAAFGATENAAKKRVAYAVEKLRKYFSKQGIVSTTAIIAGVVSANSVQAAPVALANSIPAAAVGAGAAASASTITLVKGTLKFMAWAKIKTATVVGVGILLAVGTTSMTIKKIEEHKTYSWQVPKANYQLFYETGPQVRIVPTKFAEAGGWVCDSSRGALGIGQSVTTIAQVAYLSDRLQTIASPDLPLGKFDFFAKLAKEYETDEGWAKALQEELKDKLDVVGKRELREMNVLVLQLRNPTVQGFKPADSLRRSMKVEKGTAYRLENGEFAAFNQPLDTLDSFLEKRFNLPIVNKTGLTNNYDYILKWNETDPKQPNLDSLKRALLEQLGLELAPSREAIEMLIVENAK